MITDDLVRNPGLWMSSGHDASIVISSRVRLARNIQGHGFPGWAKEAERVLVCDLLRATFAGVKSIPEPVYVDMGKLPDVDRDVLLERHLISNELADSGRGSGLIMARDERIAVMINEEDHLRLQAITPGMSLKETWEKIDAVDSELDGLVDYAFSPRLGYLTACPSNVGTGLRVSVMMHLSGLRLTNELDAVIKGLEKIGMAVRGLLGEGTEAYGNIFQISNQTSLGETEAAILDRLTAIAAEVTRHEANARARLMEGTTTYVLDQIGRAYGVLSHARLLSSKEAVDLLAGLRLGIEMGFVGGVSLQEINEIMLLTQPGHLQKMSGKIIEAEERDEVRAQMVKRRVAKVTIRG